MSHHEKNLKSILRKSQEEFKNWVEHLTDEELTYVEWLLDKAEHTLDEILLDQSGLQDAKKIIEKFTSGPVQ